MKVSSITPNSPTRNMPPSAAGPASANQRSSAPCCPWIAGPVLGSWGGATSEKGSVGEEKRVAFSQIADLTKSTGQGGPPICNYSGYLFRRVFRQSVPVKRASASSEKGAAAAAESEVNGAPGKRLSLPQQQLLSMERLFFVLFEGQLWIYKTKREWNKREAPAPAAASNTAWGANPMQLAPCLEPQEEQADGDDEKNFEFSSSLDSQTTSSPPSGSFFRQT